MGHPGPVGHVFGQAQDAPARRAQRERPHGFCIEVERAEGDKMALDKLKFIMEEEAAPRTRIRVFGVGGGGSNAVARMLSEGMSGVEFCVLNTDVQALSASPVPNQLAIGSKVTNGLGAGSDPMVGRQAALEDTERIIDLLERADMVFVTAGLCRRHRT